MTNDKKYNGWSNYETWNVALWIDNDWGMYTHRQEMAQDAWDAAETSPNGIQLRLDTAQARLAVALKDWVEEMNPIASENSLFTDLLNAALGEVDWHEIAENFLTDVEKTEEREVSQ
jgi:hypothetical protein